MDLPLTLEHGNSKVEVLKYGRRIAFRGSVQSDKGVKNDLYEGGAKYDRERDEFYVGMQRLTTAEHIVQRIRDRFEARQEREEEVVRRIAEGRLIPKAHSHPQQAGQFKELGGWWIPDKGWVFPEDTYNQALQIIKEARTAKARGNDPSAWRRMASRYPGTCCVCGKRIPLDSEIYYRKQDGARHVGCEWVEDAETICLHAVSSKGEQGGWIHGQLVRNVRTIYGVTLERYHGSTFERHAAQQLRPVDMPSWDDFNPGLGATQEALEAAQRALRDARQRMQRLQEEKVREFARQHPLDGPLWLKVVRVKDEYIKEDGLSFGLPDDEGYIHKAWCAAAPENEAVEEERFYQSEKEREQKRREEVKARCRLWEMIWHAGAAPPGREHSPAGAPIYLSIKDKNLVIGGGGRWLALDGEWVWAVQNNGLDGDDWSRNNVRTGGAGAIGRRLYLTDIPADIGAEVLGVWTRAEPNDVY